MTSTPIWQPTGISNPMHDFMRFVSLKHHMTIDNYAHLHQWSVKEKSLFWEDIALFFQIDFDVMAKICFQSSDSFFHAKWFEGAKLNFAKHLLRHRGPKVAIISYNEQGHQINLTFEELYQQVASLVFFLKTQGIQEGDRVVGILSNTHHAICAMLACSSIGAIWASCSPDFGASAIIDRFRQISPKCLFTVTAHHYQGKYFQHHDKLQQILQAIPSLEVIISVDQTLETNRASYLWQDILSYPHDNIEFAKLDFNHPLYILFSSGTSGHPKCILHSSGGVLLQHLKELGLHTNLGETDKLLFFTTCAWMMWNWMVSALALGTTLVLYDGSPIFPNETTLLTILAQTKTTVFGASPPYFASLERKNIHFEDDLSSLKAVLSTGSSLLEQQYDYIQRLIRRPIQISSISGGSDIISCFALGNPCLPVYKGELQCIGLGMDVAVFNEMGLAVVEEKGELVCRTPFPSMPIGFWGELNDEKYHSSYFSRYKNIWTHGDFAKITAHGGLIIYGRSDATLNPQGIRFGTSELYRVINQIPGVSDSIAISQDWQQDTRVILFVQLQKNSYWSLAFEQQMIAAIKQQLSPRHVPAKILVVSDIPRTMNGKVMENAVKKLVNGEDLDNLSVIVNPDCLVDYQNRRELMS